MARSEIGISFDTYRMIAGIASEETIPLRVVKVKISDPEQAGPIANKVRLLDGSNAVWDYTELKDTINKISNLLDKILTIFLTIVLTISFFSLVTTSYVNIISQTN
jgi:cell division protein FtsX